MQTLFWMLWIKRYMIADLNVTVDLFIILIVAANISRSPTPNDWRKQELRHLP